MSALGYAHPSTTLDEEARRLVREERLAHLELRIRDLDSTSPLRSAGWRRELTRFVEGEGIGLSFHAYDGINLGEKIPRIRATCVELVAEQLELAAEAKARWLTLHLGTAGMDGASERKAKRLEIARDSLQELLARTSGLPIRLAVENSRRLAFGLLKTYLGDSAPELTGLLAQLPADRVGAVFDLGHAEINPERPPSDFLAALAPRVLAMHVHANDGEEDLHHPLTATWASGRPELLALLKRSRAVLLVEHHRLEDARQSLSVLRGLDVGATR